MLISYNHYTSLLKTQSRTSFKMTSFAVRIASNFLLKIRLSVSVILMSSAVSTALVDGVVSVLGVRSGRCDGG